MDYVLAGPAIGPRLCTLIRLPEDVSLPVRWIAARDLVHNPHRLDMAPKVRLASEMRRGTNPSSVAVDSYRECISAFSAGSMIEPGTLKSTFRDFLTALESLVRDLESTGFDVNKGLLPVVDTSTGPTLVDGSHRAAAAYSINQQMLLPTVDLTDYAAGKIQTPKYGPPFFIRRAVPRDDIEAWVRWMARVVPVTAYVTWPKGLADRPHHETRAIIETGGVCDSELWYHTRITVNSAGLKSTVISSYFEDNWVGDAQSTFSGADSKVQVISAPILQVGLSFGFAPTPSAIAPLKTKLRTVFQDGQNSIHCTDNEREASYLVQSCLGEANRHFLRAGNGFHNNKFLARIRELSNLFVTYNIDPMSVLLVGSSVLGAYGIRTPGDVDFLSSSQRFKSLASSIPWLDCHTVHGPSQYDLDESLLGNFSVDGAASFIFLGARFLSLHNYRSILAESPQRTRGQDLLLVEQFLAHNRPPRLRRAIILVNSFMSRRLRSVLTFLATRGRKWVRVLPRTHPLRRFLGWAFGKFYSFIEFSRSQR